MLIWFKRIFLLLSLIGIVFLFFRSEQFGTLVFKIVSLDFAPDGDRLAVSTNKACWNYDEEYRRKLSDFQRSLAIIDLNSHQLDIIHDEPVPVEHDIQFTEWMRILGERPDYENGILPYSPIQFLGTSNRLAFYDFASNTIEAHNIDSGEQSSLVTLKHRRNKRQLTPGWFMIWPDEQSILVEDVDLSIHRYQLSGDSLEIKLALGEPFYADSQNLGLGNFIDLRLLGDIKEPRPIYGASKHPRLEEIAVTTVLQICFVKYDGQIPRRLLSHKMKVGSTILYSPDAKLMATIHRDIIRFFNVSESATEIVITNAEKFITAFAMSPDNRWFATGDNFGVVRVWDTKTFELVTAYNTSVDWRVHWLIPYACGFTWVLCFIALKKRKPIPKD